jgi:hypothetical protein
MKELNRRSNYFFGVSIIYLIWRLYTSKYWAPLQVVVIIGLVFALYFMYLFWRLTERTSSKPLNLFAEIIIILSALGIISLFFL